MRTLPILLFLLTGVVGAADETNAPVLDALGPKGAEVAKLLSDFAATKDHRALDRAQYLLGTVTSTNEQMRQASFLMSLQLLNSSLLASDPEFDLTTARKGVVNVAPPVLPNQPAVSGMSPQDILDPEARRKYEQDIAENDKIREKYNREASLQRIAKHNMWTLQLRLKAIVNSGDKQGLEWAVSNINQVILDQRRRDELVRFVADYSKQVTK
jgi:hypothetical protein